MSAPQPLSPSAPQPSVSRGLRASALSAIAALLVLLVLAVVSSESKEQDPQPLSTLQLQKATAQLFDTSGEDLDGVSKSRKVKEEKRLKSNKSQVEEVWEKQLGGQGKAQDSELERKVHAEAHKLLAKDSEKAEETMVSQRSVDKVVNKNFNKELGRDKSFNAKVQALKTQDEKITKFDEKLQKDGMKNDGNDKYKIWSKTGGYVTSSDASYERRLSKDMAKEKAGQNEYSSMFASAEAAAKKRQQSFANAIKAEERKESAEHKDTTIAMREREVAEGYKELSAMQNELHEHDTQKILSEEHKRDAKDAKKVQRQELRQHAEEKQTRMEVRKHEQQQRAQEIAEIVSPFDQAQHAVDPLVAAAAKKRGAGSERIKATRPHSAKGPVASTKEAGAQESKELKPKAKRPSGKGLSAEKSTLSLEKDIDEDKPVSAKDAKR